MANENKIPSPPAFVISLCCLATARLFFTYEGFSPISISFKLIGQLSSAHTKGHFIGMGADLHSAHVKLIGPLKWPRSASAKGNFE